MPCKVADCVFKGASPHSPVMSTFNDQASVLAFLKTRKSGSAKTMNGSAPTQAQLREMLDIAVRVPDHGKLNPWRFVLFEGDSRARIGKVFRNRWAVLHPDHAEQTLDFVAGMFMRAPLVIGVVSTAAPHAKIPEWEQQLSAGAVCYNLVLAALAMGFSAQWQTDWMAYDAEVLRDMGLSAAERIAGFIYIGQASAPLEERPRPDPMALTTTWGG
jgi:nitroreductase